MIRLKNLKTVLQGNINDILVSYSSTVLLWQYNASSFKKRLDITQFCKRKHMKVLSWYHYLSTPCLLSSLIYFSAQYWMPIQDPLADWYPGPSTTLGPMTSASLPPQETVIGKFTLPGSTAPYTCNQGSFPSSRRLSKNCMKKFTMGYAGPFLAMLPVYSCFLFLFRVRVRHVKKIIGTFF